MPSESARLEGAPEKHKRRLGAALFGSVWIGTLTTIAVAYATLVHPVAGTAWIAACAASFLLLRPASERRTIFLLLAGFWFALAAILLRLFLPNLGSHGITLLVSTAPTVTALVTMSLNARLIRHLWRGDPLATFTLNRV